MPRSQQSMESRILEWFGTAPLAVAVLVLGLVKTSVGKRVHKGPKPAVKAKVKVKVAPAVAPATPKAPLKPKVKRRKVASPTMDDGILDDLVLDN